MVKVMNVGLISLSIVFMTLSFAVAGEIHPGLKNAIDNGDYKMAKNLIEKVGVNDIYTGTLAPGQQLIRVDWSGINMRNTYLALRINGTLKSTKLLALL